MYDSKMPEVAKILGLVDNDKFNIIQSNGKVVGGPYIYKNDRICKDDGFEFGIDPGLFIELLVGKYTIDKIPWRPKDGGEYWYVAHGGRVVCEEHFRCYNEYELARLNMGNCFPSKRAAEESRYNMIEKFNEIMEKVK